MTAAQFEVLHVNCRFCGETVEIQLSDGLTLDEALLEVERVGLEKHRCDKAPKDGT